MSELIIEEKVGRDLIEEVIEDKELPLVAIIVEDRERKKFSNLGQLAASISEKGLINPITVKKIKGSEDYKLLAGERRYRAFKLLERETIPARIYPEHLNDYEIKGIEMEENLKREDFTDAERIQGLKKVHDHWTSIYGKKTSTKPNASGHSASDTAKRLNVSPQKVSEDLELARYMELIPELATLENRKDIKKMVAKAKQQVETERRVKNLKIEDNNMGKTIQHRSDAYIVGDFFEEIKKFDENSFDFAEIDIDYPIENEGLQREANTDRLYKDYKSISKEDYPEFMQTTLKETYRVLRPNSWAIVWFGLEYSTDLLKWAGAAGFVGSWYTGKWFKGIEYSATRIPYIRLGSSIEYFYYFKKVGPKLNKPHNEVFIHPPIHHSNRYHPYEKPVKLMQDILETFIEPGRTILVPFAGRGNTLIAGFDYDCNCYGFDLSDKYKPSYILEMAKRVKQQKGK